MVTDWEPRIVITDIPIHADEETSTYYIKLNYVIPELNKTGEYYLSLN